MERVTRVSRSLERAIVSRNAQHDLTSEVFTPTVLRTLWRRKRLAYLFLFDRLSGGTAKRLSGLGDDRRTVLHNFQKKTFPPSFQPVAKLCRLEDRLFDLRPISVAR